MILFAELLVVWMVVDVVRLRRQGRESRRAAMTWYLVALVATGANVLTWYGVLGSLVVLGFYAARRRFRNRAFLAGGIEE